MRVYKNANVYEGALNRIRLLYEEFDEVIANFSGGKDSTVCINLCLEVAREKNRLPLKVMWLDQEVEWEGTADMARHVMYSKDIEPLWYQMPFCITNNASHTDRYNNCWGEGEEWIREKDPISIKKNTFKEVRFHNLFSKVIQSVSKGKKACYISGVRAEETPKRLMALTNGVTYKYITWGKKLDTKGHFFTFYPIYDWTYKDVWKYIHDNNIKYNKVYDEMYRHGVRVNDMRISNLHHETAIQNLLLVQEIEPKTWEKIVPRISGVNTIKHLKKNSFVCPKDLPYMFASWEEYALHLVENLIPQDKYKKMVYKYIERYRDIFIHGEIVKAFYRKVISTILSNDWDFTKLKNFTVEANVNNYTKFMKGKPWDKYKYLRYIKDAQKN